jgi:steroid 5-alpha reductase family enzyme
MGLVEHYFVALVAAIAVQVVAFWYSLRHDRVDIIDTAWGVSFIAGVVAIQAIQPVSDPWTLLVEAMVLLWGGRLTLHIYQRFRRSDVQDVRYSQLIERWPKRYVAIQLFFRLFLVQAILASTILLPVLSVHSFNIDGSLITLIGTVIWVVGFAFEAASDRQLKIFLAQPNRPSLMTTGLRRYSRHPSYFGEITMWWGLAIIALQTPAWLWGLVGAGVITFLICFISGIPIAEKQAASKPGWLSYKRRTSILFPWPPKK